jgi:hypothetical protein
MPEPTRKPPSRSLWVIGGMNSLWTGLFVVFFPYVVVDAVLRGSMPWYVVVLLVVLAPVSLVSAVNLERRTGTLVRSQLMGLLDEQKPTGNRDYVLYLRSFLVDEALAGQDPVGGAHLLTSLASTFGYRDPNLLDDTWEARITSLFGRLGRVVAVGRPGEPLPPLGARRYYLSPTGDEWKKAVSKDIERARLVVIVAAVGEDPTSAEGTLWEFSEAVRLLPPSRLVLVAYGSRQVYERFRERAAEYYRTRAQTEDLPPLPVLPDWPAPARPAKVRKGFSFHGVVRFDAGWGGEFVHFDTTAHRGPTPYARWRRTVRTRVEPWLDECERELPGLVVYPMTFRWHWRQKALVTLVLGGLGAFVAYRWADLELSQRSGLVTALVFMAVTLARLAAITRAMGRDGVRVRPPDDTEPAEPVGLYTPYTVIESTVRWPARFPLAVLVARTHLDEQHRPCEVPRHPRWRVRTVGEEVELDPDVATYQLRNGAVVERRALVLMGVDRDLGVSSRRFGERAMMRYAAVAGTVIGTTIGAFRVDTGGQVAGVVTIGLLTALWWWRGARKDLATMYRVLMRPRLPADLLRESCVLYLRPHPDDPVPRSPVDGPLELDLRTVFSGLGLFRVGYVPDAEPPPAGLARLPFSDDWRTELTLALPDCELVVIPATGTSPGTLWQLAEAVRLVPPSRLLLLLITEEEYAGFLAAATELLGEWALRLPAELPAPSDSALPGAVSDSALLGAVHFADDWTPAVVPFSLRTPFTPPSGDRA